jgi:hypothetical protein
MGLVFGEVVSAKVERVLEIIKAEGGIGQPGWGEPQVTDRPTEAAVDIYFWFVSRGVVKMTLQKGDLWRLEGPLLDRFIKAHLEIVRVYAEAMDQ